MEPEKTYKVKALCSRDGGADFTEFSGLLTLNEAEELKRYINTARRHVGEGEISGGPAVAYFGTKKGDPPVIDRDGLFVHTEKVVSVEVLDLTNSDKGSMPVGFC